MKTKQEISAIITALKALYPDAQCSLDYGKDYELLFSVRLAAQCTDARVNLVTPALFARSIVSGKSSLNSSQNK